MHEYHIIKTLVDGVLEKNGDKKIKSITIGVGELSGFDTETVKMYMETLSENTILENGYLSTICGKIFSFLKWI